jgi:microcystin-dependent protein
LYFMAMLKGAVLPLTYESSFEEEGTLTAEECANWWREWLYALDWGGCDGGGLVVGEIKAICNVDIPDGWLLCDGRSVSRAGYPTLFSAIGCAFGCDDGDSFNLPDLRGRVPIGYGEWGGLIEYFVGDSGGDVWLYLSEDQLPAHQHAINNASFQNTNAGSGSSWSVARQQAAAGPINTSSVGAGEPIDNRMPWLCLAYYIYSG